MKIGILTFHYCDNYGAVLQAFALNYFLKEKSFCVSFIDYELGFLLRRYTYFQFYKYSGLSFLNKIRLFARTILHLPRKIVKHTKYKKFRESYFQCSSFSNNPDCLVVGSDQVWNPKITGTYDPVYYGISYSNIPHVFYAVSCPSSLLEEKQLVSIKNNNFYVGVREDDMREKLERFNIKSTLVCDPVFLLSQSEWSIIPSKNMCPQKYVFSYNLSNNKVLPKVANILSAENQLANTIRDNVLLDAGPCDFINYFRYAEITLVSSFHGTAFSIIFHRPFFYFPCNSDKDERVFSLLSFLGLEQCVFKESLLDGKISLPNIDWTSVDIKLTDLKKTSMNFLLDSISHYER